MAKILTLRNMFFTSSLGLGNKFFPEGTVLELIDCRHSSKRISVDWYTIRWKITISTECGEFSNVRYTEHKNDTPMEKHRPFMYLEN